MTEKSYTKAVLVLMALILLGASFFGGVYYGYGNRPAVEKILGISGKQTPQEFQEVDFNIVWDVWRRLEEKYVDKDKVDRQDLVYGAAAGLVKALNDPYSEFLPPEDNKQFQEDIKGAFGGIGAEIGFRKRVLTIISPLKNSPAERVGLKAGDQIFQVNGTPTADLTLNEAVRLIRGEPGTKVKLTIFRESFERTRDFAIIRDVVRVPIIETSQKENGIFVIRLFHFTETAPFEFRRAVQEFFQSGSQKLILDLRNNPGGFLNVSIDIAGWFIPAGEVVARERFGDDTERLYRSSGYRLLQDVPMVVLINGGSASASEIVAGALRDLKGTKLVGEKTFGKGSVQEVVPLQNHSSLKVTIAKWLTPNGTEINGTGLEPDVKVEISNPEDLGPEEDPILEKGIEVLKGL